ncbi:hypothetical protein [Sphingobacterium cellulitidis]|uniref:hypothetical protein n=1 Tax=Sphingobacterium cellulitidis TaxID=1768011 RepID=UPI000B93B352|nr:hypothetical protein CHT99_15585 [Sphingobacterium cellulitidis]
MNVVKKSIVESSLIDDKNHTLWKELNPIYDIMVIPNYNVYRLNYVTGSEEVHIHVTKNFVPALFTHELLHLKLRSLGLNTFDYFELTLNKFVEFMTSTICNCVEHVLFFDDFIELGYSNHEFTMDYNNSEYNLNTLKKLYSDISAAQPKPIIELFLTYAYWTLKNEEYMGVDRIKDLIWLKKTDPFVFAKCEKMFDEIIDFDLDSSTVQEDFNKLIAKYLRRNY